MHWLRYTVLLRDIHYKYSANMQTTVSTAAKSRFLIEKKSNFNCNFSVYSNHLPCHIALAVTILVIGFIIATPLSLCVTAPMLHYITQVSSSKNQSCMLIFVVNVDVHNYLAYIA